MKLKQAIGCIMVLGASSVTSSRSSAIVEPNLLTFALGLIEGAMVGAGLGYPMGIIVGGILGTMAGVLGIILTVMKERGSK